MSSSILSNDLLRVIFNASCPDKNPHHLFIMHAFEEFTTEEERKQHSVCYKNMVAADVANIGNIELLKFLDARYPRTNDLYYNIAAKGRLEMLKWLYDILPREHDQIMHPIMKSVVFKSWVPDITLNGAAYGGHVDVLEWLWSVGCRHPNSSR